MPQGRSALAVEPGMAQPGHTPATTPVEPSQACSALVLGVQDGTAVTSEDAGTGRVRSEVPMPSSGCEPDRYGRGAHPSPEAGSQDSRALSASCAEPGAEVARGHTGSGDAEPSTAPICDARCDSDSDSDLEADLEAQTLQTALIGAQHGAPAQEAQLDAPAAASKVISTCPWIRELLRFQSAVLVVVPMPLLKCAEVATKARRSTMQLALVQLTIACSSASRTRQPRCRLWRQYGICWRLASPRCSLRSHRLVIA